jgi:hypothetical protein
VIALLLGPMLDQRINIVMHQNRAQIVEQVFQPPEFACREKSAQQSVPCSDAIPNLSSGLKLVTHTELSPKVIVCYTIRFLFMLGLLHTVNIYLQILIV